METTIDWIPADERLPFDGAGVVAAVTGRYPAEPGVDPDPLIGPEFWIVLPMYFRSVHPVEGTGEVVLDCFIDADQVLRRPPGGETTPRSRAIPPTAGVRSTTITNAISAPQRTSGFERSSSNTIAAYFVP